jgi:hypothetical protein
MIQILVFFSFKYFVTCFPSIWRYKTIHFPVFFQTTFEMQRYLCDVIKHFIFPVLFLALRVTSFPVKTPEKSARTPTFGCHVTSGSPIGHAQWHILYKMYRCACARGHFRDFRSGPLSVTSLPVAHAHAITSVAPQPRSTTTNMTWVVPIYYSQFIHSSLLFNTFPLFYVFDAYPFPPHLRFLRIPLYPSLTHSTHSVT